MHFQIEHHVEFIDELHTRLKLRIVEGNAVRLSPQQCQMLLALLRVDVSWWDMDVVASDLIRRSSDPEEDLIEDLNDLLSVTECTGVPCFSSLGLFYNRPG